MGIHIFNYPKGGYDTGAMKVSVVFSYCIVTSVALLTSSTYSQEKPPLPEDYPVRKSAIFKGTPARPLLDSKRARLYRRVLRQGAKEGPNFAGRYTIVTWGAGLGVFSMAVVDANSGKVYFPPFKTVGNTAYGMPLLDKGENPAWKVDSRLFAFVGRPDANDQGMGLYVYSFDRGRFRLEYFEKEDEKEREASREAWEKDIDRRLASMAEIYGSFRERLVEGYPGIRCYQGPPKVRYPWPSLDMTCTEDDLIVGINMDYLSTPDDAAERIESELQFSSLPRWRSVDRLGDQGIETDKCSRAWVRFRKGSFYVWMNANLNKEQMDDPSCSNEQNVDSKRLAEFMRRLALELADVLNSK